MSDSAGRKVTSHSFVQHGESGWCSSQNSDFCHHHNDGGWLDCKLPRSAHAELAHPFTRQLGAGFADPGSRYRGDYCVAAVDGRECGAPESAHCSAPQPCPECGVGLHDGEYCSCGCHEPPRCGQPIHNWEGEHQMTCANFVPCSQHTPAQPLGQRLSAYRCRWPPEPEPARPSDAAKEAREIAERIAKRWVSEGWSERIQDVIASEIEPLIRERDEWKARAEKAEKLLDALTTKRERELWESRNAE